MTLPVEEEPTQTDRAAGQPDSATPADELLASVRRVERAVEEIRGRLETVARAKQHREFSVTRLVGALCQVLAVGMVVAGLVDWMYQGASARLLVELALAGVLQLGVLTAALTAHERR